MTSIIHPSTVPTALSSELERLRIAARRLWDIESNRQTHRKVGVLNELVDLDLELERLSLRAEVSLLDDDHSTRLQKCAERIRQLGGAHDGLLLPSGGPALVSSGKAA
ncbi:MAG: hypothetical protein HKN94_09430 [Acidimicrobiales bacterium]|nr:hypothetical protein [Acidimicrobiales bacterium]RZV48350.1 MAG: hypothetical protein EX269_02065 [Acidimicrobiales bacterium]